MNKLFGGKQKIPHDTNFFFKDGFLGPSAQKLSVGDTQSFVFKPKDDGPF